jgi:hypothetical protein
MKHSFVQPQLLFLRHEHAEVNISNAWLVTERDDHTYHQASTRFELVTVTDV